MQENGWEQTWTKLYRSEAAGHKSQVPGRGDKARGLRTASWSTEGTERPMGHRAGRRAVRADLSADMKREIHSKAWDKGVSSLLLSWCLSHTQGMLHHLRRSIQMTPAKNGPPLCYFDPTKVIWQKERPATQERSKKPGKSQIQDSLNRKAWI